MADFAVRQVRKEYITTFLVFAKTVCVLVCDHNEYSCDEPMEHGEITRICTGIFEMRLDC